MRGDSLLKIYSWNVVMTLGLGQLLVAAFVWMAMHLVVSGTQLRAWIVKAIGEGAFRAAFSLASAASLAWLIWSYVAAGPLQSLWVTPRWVIVLCMLLMLPALVLFVGSVTTPNPTMVAGQRALKAEHPAHGILRVTRHPMLWSFAIWAGVHLVMIGTLSATVFFGAFLIVASQACRVWTRRFPGAGTSVGPTMRKPPRLCRSPRSRRGATSCGSPRSALGASRSPWPHGSSC